MPYPPQTWHDLPTQDTPISAARLAVIENGIAAAQTTYNVKAYGAVGNGSTDDTTAIAAAITAAGATGVVFFPNGTYITQPQTISGNITIRGDGWASILKLKASSNGYILTFSPGTGFITADLAHLGFNGNATNQTSGGCIYGAGSVQSRFDNIHFTNAYDACLWLYQNTSPVTGHHNRVTRCLFDNLNTVTSANQQGIRLQSSDENFVAFCDFENWGGLTTAGSEPYAIKDWSGLQIIIGNVFVGGREAIRIQDASSTRIIGNTFDGVGKAAILMSGSKNVVMGNLFSNGSGGSAGGSAQCEIDNSSSAVVVGNSFTVTTSGQVRNCVREYSSSSDKSLIVDNIFDLSGGSLYSSNPAIELHGSVSSANNNEGAAAAGPSLQLAGVVKVGAATLVAGQVTVSDTAVTANSIIRVSEKTLGGTPGALFISAKSAGASFTIKSTSASDTSVVQYEIVAY